MEFKFRAVDDRPPICPHPPSTISYFTEIALRDQWPRRNPSRVGDVIQWELEKQRIREEIILAEIARRRALEAEVRTELMIEREMAMRRLTTTTTTPTPTPKELLFEERLAMQLDWRLPALMHAFPSCIGAMMPQLSEAMPLDIKPPSESNKDKFIGLAKPTPNLSGTKRKAVTLPAGSTSELLPFGLKKRPEEWSCALCRVNASNEKGFNDHLQGRKHKAKEAGLRAQGMGKIASSRPLPKETTNPSMLADATNIGSSGLQARVEEKSLHQNKVGDGSDQKMEMMTMPDPRKLKAVTPPAGSTSELWSFGLKMGPEEWSCALCQVSTSNERGFNYHLQGKKHKAKEAGLGAQTMGKIASSTPLPKETTKPSKLADATNIGSSGLQARVEGESLHQSKIGGGSDQKMEITEDLKNENEQVLLQKNQNADDSKKTNGMATDKAAEKITEFKNTKNFKFWCEMCQIGAYSQLVMEAHIGGKKHRARLQERGEKDGFDVPISAMAAPANTQKDVDTDLVAKEANEKTAETVIADEEKSGSSPVEII